MGTNFTFYRVLCTTPPELESERLAFEAAVAQFVEEVTMPDAVLFAAASLRPPIRAVVQKATIESNIRMCEFFIQVFGEQLPDPVFPGFVEYALACVADTSTVTRKACVLFRNYHAAAPQMQHFREKLAAGDPCEVRDFGGEAELAEQLRELLCSWYAPLKPPSA
jgi:hypothetical protein